MARLRNYLIMLVLFFATIMATISYAKEQESLYACGNHMGSKCGDEVVNALSSHKKNLTISKACCYKVIQTGYSCITRLALFVLDTDEEFQNENATEIVEKNDKIYNMCDEATKPADNQGFLSKCVEKIGTKCGAQIYEKLFHDKNKVSKHCCEKLVNMGLACHISMAKALIRTPSFRNVNAIHFLKKSKNVFLQCRNEQ